MRVVRMNVAKRIQHAGRPRMRGTPPSVIMTRVLVIRLAWML
jgi:hypothetical protein